MSYKKKWTNIRVHLKDNFLGTDIQIDCWSGHSTELLIKAAILLGRELFTKVVASIDLNQDQSDIFRNLRKSFKGLINKQGKERKTVILFGKQANRSFWNDFRELHFKDAGRITRSEDTWNQQFEDILIGNSYCVLQYIENKLISGGYFLLSETHVYYGVSASSLGHDMQRPGIHSMLFEAILFAKKIERKSFLLGFSEITSKDIKQSHLLNFKMGFGKDLTPIFCLR